MNSYRIRFKLPGDVAEVFSKINDKPDFITKAIIWYIQFGKEINGRLDKIENLLVNKTITVNKIEPEQTLVKSGKNDPFGKFTVQ